MFGNIKMGFKCENPALQFSQHPVVNAVSLKNLISRGIILIEINTKGPGKVEIGMADHSTVALC